MTTGIKKLLQRMISPSADLRCTASQAMADECWRPSRESLNSHSEHAYSINIRIHWPKFVGRSSSYTSSVIFEKDMAKLIDRTPSSTRSAKGKLRSPPGLDSPLSSRSDLSSRQVTKFKSPAAKGAHYIIDTYFFHHWWWTLISRNTKETSFTDPAYSRPFSNQSLATSYSIEIRF